MGGAHYRDTSFVFPFQVAGQLKKLQSGSLYTTLNMIFTGDHSGEVSFSRDFAFFALRHLFPVSSLVRYYRKSNY